MKPDAFDHVLPAMQCDKGCGECCGVVPASGAEFDRVASYAKEHGIQPRAQGLTCPWYHDGLCSVYAARPLICRSFGHVQGMSCPRGYDALVSPGMAKAIATATHREAKRTGVRLLHEVLMSAEAVEAMVVRELNKKTQATLTVGGKAIPKPANLTYQAARAMKSVGLGFANTAFVDENGKGIQ